MITNPYDIIDNEGNNNIFNVGEAYIMFNGLKTWQKAILITVFSVIGAFMTAWFAVWLDNKINPISKYWDESSSPVDIHALNDKNDDTND